MPLTIQQKMQFLERQNQYANQLLNSGQAIQASQVLEEMVESFPSCAAFWNNLGLVRLFQQDHVDAERCFRQAVERDPKQAQFHHNLGLALAKQERDEEALPHMLRAVEMDPKLTEAWRNLGCLYGERQQEAEKAIEAYSHAIKLNPMHADCLFGRGVCQLRLGRFLDGWFGYEWRLKSAAYNKDHPPGKLADWAGYTPPANIPQWQGQRIDNGILLLSGEQGAGDTIQFLRYVPLIKLRCPRLILECHGSLVRLFKANLDIEGVHEFGEDLPDYVAYHYLTSSGFVFGTVLETIPCRIPYLRSTWTEQQRRLTLRSPRKRIGICYQGNKRHENTKYRDIDPKFFSDLALRCPQFEWISLQYGAETPQHFVDQGSQFTDFLNVANALEHIDLVITCDTSMAHLAGAMGKPCWVLLPFNADWRWMMDREDSPWYPTLRLFRQNKLGEWGPVFDQVATCLNTALSHTTR